MGGELLEKTERQKSSQTQISKFRNGQADKLLSPISGEGVSIQYTAPKRVRDAIAALGRTEDIKFSPSNSRLAVASFLTSKIAVFDVSISASASGRTITLTDVAEFSSIYLNQPHGVCFIDDEKIIVANRAGDATIFKLPLGGSRNHQLVPLEIIHSDGLLDSPGAVSIIRKEEHLYEALICNNFTNKITRHLIENSKICSVRSNEVLLKKWLNLPDGISVCDEWIAVSNHNSHSVLLYRNSGSLNQCSDPDGILRRVHYPHGLRFSSDGRFILVADAGAPYVHVYARDESGWGGVRSPYKSVRVLTDENFLRGRHSIHDGGPKGIDIDNSMSTVVTTCEAQPLAFFDFARFVEIIPSLSSIEAYGLHGETLDASFENETKKALEIKYDLYIQDQCTKHELDIQDYVKQEIARIKNSRSWRITAPLRRVGSLLRRLPP